MKSNMAPLWRSTSLQLIWALMISDDVPFSFLITFLLGLFPHIILYTLMSYFHFLRFSTILTSKNQQSTIFFYNLSIIFGSYFYKYDTTLGQKSLHKTQVIDGPHSTYFLRIDCNYFQIMNTKTIKERESDVREKQLHIQARMSTMKPKQV